MKLRLLLSFLYCKLLNSNIRCIEISWNQTTVPAIPGWIVTLDVLKLSRIRRIFFIIQLNSNIRCIEMFPKYLILPVNYELNSNIRCIEIIYLGCKRTLYQSWIVTLDVLKFSSISSSVFPRRLNSNIRCIEIVKHKMAVEHFLVE